MSKRTPEPRLMRHGDAVVSVVLRAPRPTHTPFDALAAAVTALAPGPRVLLLGFAGGSIAAVMRALGWPHAIDAVDLDPRAGSIYRAATGAWGGRVAVRRAEAGRFLETWDGPHWDAIVEDLSIPEGGTLTKPPVSLGTLPERARAVLTREGVCVTNLLPVRGWSWERLLARIASPYPHAIAISFDEWDNRLVIAGRGLSDARRVAGQVRRELTRIGSRIAATTRARTLV